MRSVPLLVLAWLLSFSASVSISQLRPKSAFIFGLGFVGRRFASQLVGDGWDVAGTCRSAEKAQELKSLGIRALLFDDEEDAPSREISEAVRASSCVLNTVPPTRVFASAVPPYGGSLYKDAGDAVLHNYVSDLSSASWVGYLSSTSVYGNRGGDWVSESDAIEPDQPKAIARAEAEKAWLSLHRVQGVPVHAFRLAGIYGPGRSAIDTVRKNRGDYWACAPDDFQLISRIHVADICTALRASVAHPSPGLVLNVADDEPAERSRVLRYACALLNYPIAERPSEPLEPGAGVRGGSKRVSNKALKELLAGVGSSLAYPTFREGLRACL